MVQPLTRRSIFAQAWPIMLGQTTVPLVGVVDTAVIGRTGDATALAGVALGVTIVNFLFWSFGFLRMGMTGTTAQAAGAGDEAEVRALLIRGVLAGLAIGALLFAAQLLLIPLALTVMAGGGELDRAAHGFVSARFFGAPASLAVFAINGWLLGLGRSRDTLLLQMLMNLASAALDVAFVWHFHWGARGVGLGTSLAEWIALAIGLVLCWRASGGALLDARLAHLLDGAALKRMFAVNADIMIRTVALLTLFAWFASAGARLGAVTLAANQVLMQAVSISAFVLDGFAFIAESRVGHAIGAGDGRALTRAIRLTAEFCLGFSLIAAVLILAGGRPAIALLTTNGQVRETASSLLPLVVLLPLIGTPAWLLDGVFIGATRGRALRNAAIAATALYIVSDLLLRPFGLWGLWIAFAASYVWRALTLGTALPALLRSVRS